MLPLHPVVALHDVGVQGLLVLGGVVAALPAAGEPDMLALTVLLPRVLVQEVLVAVALATGQG